MSYAEVAANPPEVNAKKRADKLETDYENLKKEVEGIAKEAYEDGKSKGERLKEELKELEKEGETYLAKVFESLKRASINTQDYLSTFVSKTSESTSTALTKTIKEFENPVVVIQTLVGITGIAAGYAGYLERHRINTDNRLVVSIHASIITGLVLLDGFLFTTYYPKYDKKKKVL